MFNGNNGDNGMYMPVAPLGFGGYGGGYGNNGFFGGDGIWALLVIALLFGGGLGGWGGFGGFGGWGGMMGMDAMMLAPYFFNTQTQNDVNRGFDTQNLAAQISSVQSSVDNLGTRNQLSDIQNSISTGFANAEVANCNRAMDAMQTAYNNQIASMNQNFANQQALDARLGSMEMAQQQCCCDNLLQSTETRNTVVAQAAENRYQALSNTQSIIAAGKADTQLILDKLCQLELDGVKNQLAQAQRENVGLQNQLNMANLAASQVAQTAELRTSQATVANQLVSELRSCPIPSQPVYGNTPIFSCSGNGCGCNANTFFN